MVAAKIADINDRELKNLFYYLVTRREYFKALFENTKGTTKMITNLRWKLYQAWSKMYLHRRGRRMFYLIVKAQAVPVRHNAVTKGRPVLLH